MKRNVFETSIFDHHKMISNIMKLDFTKENPKTKCCNEYLKFDIHYFNSKLSFQLDSTFCTIKQNEDFEE